MLGLSTFFLREREEQNKGKHGDGKQHKGGKVKMRETVRDIRETWRREAEENRFRLALPSTSSLDTRLTPRQPLLESCE